MAAIAIACLVFSSVATVAVLPVAGLPASLIAALVVAMAQIVMLAQILSELGTLSAPGFLAGHVVLAVLALLWFRRAQRTRTRPLLPDRENVFGFVRRNPLLCGAGAVVIAIYVANFAATHAMPVYIADAMSYHLARAAFWLELGSARHFYTNDFRMTEFPPNSSFVSAWIMAFFGRGFAWLHVPQWLAGIALGVGTVALSRSFGLQRAPAVLAGVLVTTAPIVVVQTSTAQNDLIASALTLAALVFAVRFTLAPVDGPDRRGNLVYAGAAFGTALGTKLTALYLVPGVAIALAVLAFRGGDPQAGLRRLLRLGGVLAAGFVLFASYNVVLNLIDFGHPVISAEARKLLQVNYTPANTDPVVNVGRYLYQFLDWPGLAASSDDALPQMQRSVQATVGRYAGVSLFAPPVSGALEHLGGPHVSAEQSGYGPVGFVFIVLSLPVCAGLGLAGMVRRDPRLLGMAALIASFWLFIVLVAATRPWTPNKARYFITGLAIAVALSTPVFYRWRLARLLAWPVLAVSLWVAYQVVKVGHGEVRAASYAQRLARPGETPLYYHWGGIQAAQIDVLRSLAGPGARVGVDVKVDIPLYALMGGVPEIAFVPMPLSEIRAGIAAGRLAAGLSSFDRVGRVGEPDAVPLVNDPELMLIAPELDSWLARHIDLHGIAARSDGSDWALHVKQQAVTGFTGNVFGHWSRAAVRLELPVVLFPAGWTRATIVLQLEKPAPKPITISVSCLPRPVEIAAGAAGIAFELARDCVPGKPASRRLWIEKPDGSPALRIIGIWMTNLAFEGDSAELPFLLRRLEALPARRVLPEPITPS